MKVHKATNSPFAREVIERIGAVYAIEERIRGLDAGERRAARQVETKPLMEALKARLVAVKDGISRRSTLIKAIDYMLERWEGLTAFLDDGRLEPDTNTVERSIRPIAIGKKNSLFSGDEGGGETWAILSSLLNTAKLNGVDPEAYLTDVLERMVSGRTTNDRLHEPWPGTGRLRARPKSAPRHDAIQATQGTRTAGSRSRRPWRTTPCRRAARTVDERARQVADASPSAGDVAPCSTARWPRWSPGRSRCPEEWVCPLLGVDPNAFNRDTQESAIAAR